MPSRPSIISVVRDETDPLIANCKPQPILALFKFGDDKNREAYFRFQLITDMRLSPMFEYHLPGGAPDKNGFKSTEPWHRERLILAFYDSVSGKLQTATSNANKKPSLSYSECFSKIASELTNFSKYQTAERTLIVFSDLQENTSLFSCYKEKDKQILKQHPDTVASLFTTTYPIPDNLSGTEIFFVYQSTTRADESSFFSMYNLYKRILEQRSAKVHLQTNAESFTE